MTFQRKALSILEDLYSHTRECPECRRDADADRIHPEYFAMMRRMLQSSFRLDVSSWNTLTHDNEALKGYLDCCVAYFMAIRDTYV